MNSVAFLGAFLPLTQALWWLPSAWAGIRIALASLFFYAVWDVRYLAVLLGSVGVNFWLGGKILAARTSTDALQSKRWMVAGGFQSAGLAYVGRPRDFMYPGAGFSIPITACRTGPANCLPPS